MERVQREHMLIRVCVPLITAVKATHRKTCAMAECHSVVSGCDAVPGEREMGSANLRMGLPTGDCVSPKPVRTSIFVVVANHC